LGKKLLSRFAADLTAYGSVESMPRLEGRNAHILISPVKTVVKPAASGSAKASGPGEQPPPSAPSARAN
jgi:translation initiation factor IF-3